MIKSFGPLYLRKSEGSFAVRLISVRCCAVHTLLWDGSAVLLLVKRKVSCFWRASKASWQILKKEKNSNYPRLYFSLDKSMGLQRMSGQNDKNSRGLSLAQPINPSGSERKVRVKQKESIKNAIMGDMKQPADKVVSQQWDIPTVQ